MKNRAASHLRWAAPIKRSLLALSIAVLFAALHALGAPVSTSWTYQGQLRRSGAPYTGICNFQFRLWDDATAGTQTGSTLPINGVVVTNGLFSAALDFGAQFSGGAQWLGTSVQCSGDGGFTSLNPRQAITAAPYALGLRPGATISQDSDVFPALSGYNGSLSGIGITAIGHIGLDAVPVGDDSIGVRGEGSGANGAGVFGKNNYGGGPGVRGLRQSVKGAGIYGENSSGGYAGRFAGPVLVQGNLLVSGTLFKSAGSFRIDHPLDPEHKVLSHSFVESPEMMNIYNGNVTTDATGMATVRLPAYFSVLNREFRYQLTVLGQFAQAIVSRKASQDNTFEIRTDKPGVEVSWQVTGIRQDAYARDNPIVVEQAKPAEEDGKYLYPAGFGAGMEMAIGHSGQPRREVGAADRLGAAQQDQANCRNMN